MFYRKFFNFIYGLKIKLKSKKMIRKQLCTPSVADVVISLTSYWKRFDTLYLTLDSLFSQITSINYSVILVLSEDDIEKYSGMPDKIDRYIDKGLVIKVVKENLKSYKKAYYTYDIGKPIITVDDDIYYPSWWLNKLMIKVEQNPGAVVSYRGHYVLKFNENILPYKYWLLYSEKNYINIPTNIYLPTGVSGVYYPVSSLNGLGESEKIFLDICPNADDLWLKFITFKNGFKAIRVDIKNYHFFELSSEIGLFSYNGIENGNDKQLKNIMQYSEKFMNTLLIESISCEKNYE